MGGVQSNTVTWDFQLSPSNDNEVTIPTSSSNDALNDSTTTTSYHALPIKEPPTPIPTSRFSDIMIDDSPTPSASSNNSLTSTISSN